MTAQINEDTAAMNTARQSAVSIKLKPIGRFALTEMVLPARTTGIMDAAATKDADIAANARAFRSLVDTKPQSGAMTAPISGMKTQDSSNCSFVIFLSKIKKSQQLSGLQCPTLTLTTRIFYHSIAKFATRFRSQIAVVLCYRPLHTFSLN